MSDDNPYEVLAGFPVLDYSDGAVAGFDINSVSESPKITAEEWDCLFGESVSAAAILVRLGVK